MKRQYALLFTLLTIGLAIGANAGMKRWGTGDVINGRDLTNNFDITYNYGWKKQNFDTTGTTIKFGDGSTSVLYSPVNIVNNTTLMSSVFVSTSTGFDGGTNQGLVSILCGKWNPSTDGGSDYWTTNTTFSLGYFPAKRDSAENISAFSGERNVYVDAGSSLCGIKLGTGISATRSFITFENFTP